MMDGEQYRLIVENAPNMLWRAALDKMCDYFNATWLAFTGRTMAQEVGNGWTEGVHPDDFDRCLQTYLSAFDERKPFEMEYRLRRADGVYRWLNDHGTPYYDSDGVFAGYIGSCMDVTERIEGMSLMRMAHTDELTGLLSRSRFRELAEQELERAKRYHTPLCLIMADIDHFKQVNDTHGHRMGDLVLIRFAHFLTTHVRHFDLIGRQGGDEFVLLMPETSEADAMHAIRHLVESLKSETIQLQSDPYAPSASFGVAALRDDDSFTQLLERADMEMYRAKHHALNSTV